MPTFQVFNQANQPFNITDAGWGNYNVRQLVLPRIIPASKGTEILVNFSFAAGTVGTLDSCYIGHQDPASNLRDSSGSTRQPPFPAYVSPPPPNAAAYVFNGDQVQLTFGGSGSRSLQAGDLTFAADVIPFPWDHRRNESLLMAFHCTGTINFLRTTGNVAIEAYYTLGADSSSQTNPGAMTYYAGYFYNVPTIWITLGIDSPWPPALPAITAWDVPLTRPVPGWNGGFNNNIRQQTRNVPALKGTDIVLRFQFATQSSGIIDSVYIGYVAATGNPWDFDGDQVQVTFHGAPDVALGEGGFLNFSSDVIPFDWDATGDKLLMVAMFIRGEFVLLANQTANAAYRTYYSTNIQSDTSSQSVPSGSWTSAGDYFYSISSAYVTPYVEPPIIEPPVRFRLRDPHRNIVVPAVRIAA